MVRNPWAEKGAAMADLGDPAWRGMVCVETSNFEPCNLQRISSKFPLWL